jgi:hypothetical protein
MDAEAKIIDLAKRVAATTDETEFGRSAVPSGLAKIRSRSAR